MITFTLCLFALLIGYCTYGRLCERIFAPDNRITPAIQHADGIDYMVLPPWKIFMIQFLNIAGVGPIFGAIMGAMFGTASFLWIVLGSIFAGAVHDYFSGMLSPCVTMEKAFLRLSAVIWDCLPGRSYVSLP